MSFIEDAIKALYGDMPVKYIEFPGSKLPHEAFVQKDEKGNILRVVVTNEPGKNEKGELEVKPPPVPEGKDHTFEKPESNLTVKQDYDAQKADEAIEVKP